MRGLKRAYRRSLPSMSEINVTPLVDVMMVLLVIFMVTAPLARHGLEIQLPKVSAKGIQNEEKWVIAIYPDRKIFFNEKLITVEDLQERLITLVDANPAANVFLKADETLPYGFVVKVMAAARHAGVQNLGMVTEPLAIQE